LSEQGEFVSCLLSLLRQMTDRHYQQLLDSFNTKEDLRVSNRIVYPLVQVSFYFSFSFISLENIPVL